MEKIRNITLIFCLIVGCISPAHGDSETYMAAQQAQKKFGTKVFDQQQFKKGDRKLRGEMAADLVLKKIFAGKPLKAVAELLGPPDGYFENKGIPAYIISQDVTNKDLWQLIFLPDKDWKKVDEVRIHKNCCD
jgi:hypothetical protein